MSQKTANQRIRQNPKFAQLVASRTRFAVLLSLVVLIPYYSFMMLTAFNPAFLAQPIAPGSVISIGWPIGIVLVVGSWLLTGLYVRRANGEFDQLNAEILKDSAK